MAFLDEAPRPEMIIERADLVFARETLRSFMDTAALSRAIQEIPDHPYAFTVAQRTAFDTAVISWCILFGSDHAEQQQIHWKNMFDVEEFRERLLPGVGMNLDEWRAYRQGLVDYRNELAAHRDLNPKTRFHPNFHTALRAADAYYAQLREKVLAETGKEIGGRSLIEEFEDRLRKFREQMSAAIVGVPN